MKNLLLIALILILTGCPGKGKEGHNMVKEELFILRAIASALR